MSVNVKELLIASLGILNGCDDCYVNIDTLSVSFNVSCIFLDDILICGFILLTRFRYIAVNITNSYLLTNFRMVDPIRVEHWKSTEKLSAETFPIKRFCYRLEIQQPTLSKKCWANTAWTRRTLKTIALCKSTQGILWARASTFWTRMNVPSPF